MSGETECYGQQSCHEQPAQVEDGERRRHLVGVLTLLWKPPILDDLKNSVFCAFQGDAVEKLHPLCLEGRQREADRQIIKLLPKNNQLVAV